MNLFVVFAAAQIGAEIAQRLRLPAVIGEIAAGMLVSPYALGWIQIDPTLEGVSEIGAVLLLFAVGLETHLDDLKKVGGTALAVGSCGVVVPFIAGGLWAFSSGFPFSKAMFVGAAFVATSAGITARVLTELGVISTIESRVILAAAVIDDILAMLLLGVVTSFEAKGSVDVLTLGLVLVQAVAFLGLIAYFGTRLIRSNQKLLDLPMSPLSPLTLALTLCLGLAAASLHVGLAAIIGAFLAGMILSESEQRAWLEEQMRPIAAFLVPFFFVLTGARVELAELTDWSAVATVLLVTLLAAGSKIVGCGLGAWRLGRRSALIVGVGMMPRGEVGIIVASLGLAAGVFPNRTYAVIIAMSLLTSIVAPPILKALFVRRKAAEVE